MIHWFLTRSLLFVGLFLAQVTTAGLDSAGVDTTSLGYRIGHQIGSWLPFILLVLIMAGIVARNFRWKNK